MTQTIGDEDTAREARDWYLEGQMTSGKGFTFIGMGCSRACFLHNATGVVYKVGETYSNTVESEVAMTLLREIAEADLPFPLRVPVTTTYLDGEVNAQEYATDAVETVCGADEPVFDKNHNYVGPGDCTCVGQCYRTTRSAVQTYSGLLDIHSENVLVDPHGVFWLIDLAC